MNLFIRKLKNIKDSSGFIPVKSKYVIVSLERSILDNTDGIVVNELEFYNNDTLIPYTLDNTAYDTETLSIPYYWNMGHIGWDKSNLYDGQYTHGSGNSTIFCYSGNTIKKADWAEFVCSFNTETNINKVKIWLTSSLERIVRKIVLAIPIDKNKPILNSNKFINNPNSFRFLEYETDISKLNQTGALFEFK